MIADLWSGRKDSNLRPPGPKPGALPDCATPRKKGFIMLKKTQKQLFTLNFSNINLNLINIWGA